MATTDHQHILFPGRHHLLTRYQATYLHRVLAGEVTDTAGRPVRCAPDAIVVFAVTSANHDTTRRNPFEHVRRSAAIERFAAAEELPCLSYGIADTVPTPRFATVVLTSIELQSGRHVTLTPDSCVVACSIPPVAAMYEELGFAIVTVELDAAGRPPARPWTVIELLAGVTPTEDSDHTVAGVRVRDGATLARELAHPASLALLDDYHLTDRLRMLFHDPVIGEDATLTDTRSYDIYASSFEAAAPRKWAQVAPHVRPGRIVDIGCASGGLLAEAGRDPRLRESDLFGVEVDRHLYTTAVHKAGQHAFPNPNTFFVHRNIMTGDIFPAATIDTTTTVALTHEIASYGDGVADLARLARQIHTQTRPGGVWINADVLGPDDPDRVVHLALATDDGEDRAAVGDLDARPTEEVGALLAGMSTTSRLRQFAHDFPRLSGATFEVVEVGHGTFTLTLRCAMEFLTRKDYTENWLSECHERFCDMTFADWTALATDVGFEVEHASTAWRNDWLISNRIQPVATMTDARTGDPVDWPVTHVLLVASRPH